MKRRAKLEEQNVRKEKFQRQGFYPLTPKTENQSKLIQALQYNTLVGAVGCAGTGKTMLSCYHAAKQFYEKKIHKIVLLRAYQPLAGRTIGFMPGTAEEKLKPYYQQMLDYFEDFLGKGVVDIAIKHGSIEMCSLETIRGRSWEDAVIIVDESQNLFVPEVQALVTRVGTNSQIIFCGDNTGLQSDVINGLDGLTYLFKLVNKYNISDTAFVEFDRDDICRSDITKEFVIAFEEEIQSEKAGYDVIIQTADMFKQHKKGR